MNRRTALSLLASLPFAARLQAQTKPTVAHRVSLSQGHGFLIEPAGTLQTWVNAPGGGDGDPAPDVLGLGHNRPVFLHTLYPVPGVTNVVTAVSGAVGKAERLEIGEDVRDADSGLKVRRGIRKPA